MLGGHQFPALLLTRALAWVLTLSIMGLAMVAFSWNRESVFFDGAVYFTDGDCYARMTRVRQFQEKPFTSIRTHEFENFPEGTRPHTTAPLDVLIAALAAILAVGSAQSLALAGAVVSPLLGLLTLLALAIWAALVRLPFRAAVLLMLAVSPIVVHGFELGRPDHQSLLIFLIAVALAAETAIRGSASVGARYVSAVSWGIALWVSLFEPLVLMGIVFLGRGIRFYLRGDRAECRADSPAGRFGPPALFAGILAAALVWDGWRAAAFDPHFRQWAANIGELRHGDPAVLFSWTGWLLAALPPLLLFGYWKSRDPLCLLWLALVLATAGLTLWHLRWGYFLVLTFAMALPWALAAIRWRWLAWLAFGLSLWPVASEWDRMLFPNDEAFRGRAERVVDAVALRDAALSLRGMPARGVLAPWWFSPAVVWWSGQPCVAGTSHQSLPGIVDASGFYLSRDPVSAKQVLDRRKVGYVIAYEPDRVVANAAQILSRPAPEGTLAERLYSDSRGLAGSFKLIHRNRFFRVYEVLPDSQSAHPAP